MRRVDWSALFCVVLLCVIAGMAQGGSGWFDSTTGVFDLIVSVRFDADEDELDDIEARFEDASDLLCDATDGEMRFGTVTIWNNRVGGEFADVWVFGPDPWGSNVSNAHVGGLGGFGPRVNFYWIEIEDNTFGSDTLVHEWGHYALGLYDEYETETVPVQDAWCRENDDGSICEGCSASLMDDYTVGTMSEFCVGGNHDPDHDTEQHHFHGESCWETIARIYPTVAAPTGDPSESPPSSSVCSNPSFAIATNPTIRVVLVLDRSGSMNGPGSNGVTETRLEQLGSFASAYIAEMSEVNALQLGIVSYSYHTDVVRERGLMSLDSTNKGAAQQKVTTLSAGGLTSIGGGLREAYNMLSGVSSSAGPRIIILMTDGYHNNGPEDPLDVVDDIVDAGIHLHTLGLGDSINDSLLASIAKESGGIFYKATDGVEMSPAFAALAALTIGGDTLAGPIRDHIVKNEVIALEDIFVEDGAEQVSFGVGWWYDYNELDLILVSPSGQAVAAGDPRVTIHEGDRYVIYTIESPESGYWEIWVDGRQLEVETDFVFLATILNPLVHLYGLAPPSVVEYPEPIRIEAIPTYLDPVLGAEVYATVFDPDGVPLTTIELLDNGDPANGDTEANDGVYTGLFGDYPEGGSGTYRVQIVASTVNGGERYLGEPFLLEVGRTDNRETPVPPFIRSSSVFAVVTGVPGDPPDDADGDGISDDWEDQFANGDCDGDGIPNSQELDSDNDDISDLDEGTEDADGDGKPDFCDADCPSCWNVALVLDVGGRGDLSFNDMAFVGADRAVQDFGINLVEVQSATAADYLPNFRNLARTGNFDVIIGIGFLLGDALGTVAAEFPNQKFGIIDVDWITGPNIMNVVFRENEMSALIGCLAGMVAADYGYAATGVVLGIPIPVLFHFEAGYRFGQDWGLRKYAELTGSAVDVAMLYNYTGTFSDIALGKAASEAMLAQGAVGIYNVAGPLGIGDHEAVVEAHDAAGTTYGPPYYFGVDANQDWLGEGKHALASGMKRVDVGVYSIIQAVVDGTFEGGVVSLGLAEDGVGISGEADLVEFIDFAINAGVVDPGAYDTIVSNWMANRQTVAKWIWDAVNELEAGILDGSIVVPTANSDDEINAIRAQYPLE